MLAKATASECPYKLSFCIFAHMTNRFAENIRILRLSKKMTQAMLAEAFNLNRTTVSAWEDGRAEPRVAVLLELSAYFGISLDALIYGDAEHQPPKAVGNAVRVLTIPVDARDGTERISIVPVKAAAGYASGYGDLDFIAGLPTFRMPVNELPQDMTLRMFQIEGDSMLPIRSGSYILASYVDDRAALGARVPCIVVTQNDGIVFKRVERIAATGNFRLHSDNPEFASYELEGDHVLELWRARAFLGFDFDLRMDEQPSISERLRRIEEHLSLRNG